MARPAKKGLAYFPKDVDFYQDEKIVDLSMKYGPLGLTVFDVLLTLVYREGYYLELPLRKVGQMIVRTVGESWFRKTGMSAVDLSVEVILYCAEIGLINAPLVRQNVITSVGIQTRYAAVTARNKVNLTNYWLLDKRTVDEVLESAPKKRVSATETRVSVTKTPVSATEMPQRKENKIKENISDIGTAEPVENPELSTVSTDHPSDDLNAKLEFIKGEFARLLPELPAPQSSTKLMSNVITAQRPASDYTTLFVRAAQSSFLSKPKNGRDAWKCSIEWLTDGANMDKVLSGKYDDHREQKAPKKETVRYDGVESGFDTEEFFRAALRRGMNGG